MFLNQAKQGPKLSLSYSVLALRDVERGNGKESIPLGIICVDWKPNSLPLQEDLATTVASDQFGLVHGPLSLLNLNPVTCFGPQCQVLPSPFSAKLLKCPSAPKVGSPFSVLYQVTNRTAKSQTLVLRLNEAPGRESETQLLGAGKLEGEVQMAPFEEKTFSFTFMSMVAGKVHRPPLTVYSGRHQTWVINELASSRQLFVMP